LEQSQQTVPVKEEIAKPVDKIKDVKTAFSRNTRAEKMSRMRRTIATRLVSAKNNTGCLLYSIKES